eukprot:m.73725 g.73725  ORF g.73725 m.73725 type:complete len:62 (-) comp14376_c0_seq2:2144-2329(-)
MIGWKEIGNDRIRGEEETIASGGWLQEREQASECVRVVVWASLLTHSKNTTYTHDNSGVVK